MTRGRLALLLLRLGGGGVPRVQLALAGAFLKRGFEVDIVVFRAEGPRCEHVPSGARVISLGARNVRGAILPLRGYLRERRPNALISAMEGPNLAAVIARAGMAEKPRLAVGTHSVLSRVLKERMSARTRLWMPRALRLAYRQADVVFAVSHGAGADMAETIGLPRDRVQVLHNPAINGHAHDPNGAVPHPWLAREDGPVVLGVGRLTRLKDFGTLLRAFTVVRRNRQARLMLLGDGPERANLESLARALGLEDGVAFLGFVDDPHAYMSRADLVALSSRYEGFGIVIAEALACGCPVVATDCPHGPREILSDGRYGRLVPVGDHERLAQAILETLASPPDPEFLRQRALDFRLDKIVDQYREALGI